MLSQLLRRSRLNTFSTESDPLSIQPNQSKFSSSRLRINNLRKRFPIRALLLIIIVFLLVLVVIIPFFSLSFTSVLSLVFPTHQDSVSLEDLNTSFHPTNSSLISNHSRVHVWAPAGSCKGLFVSSQAKHSVRNLPYAILRDAVVDRRLLSRTQFRKANPSLPSDLPFERIILYLTLHLSVRLTKNEAQAVLTRPLSDTHSSNASEHIQTQAQSLIPGLRTNVDYVTHVDPFVFNKKKYHPKYRTTHNRQVSEWQIAISLTPDLEMNQSPYKLYTQKQFTELIRQLSVGSNPASFSFGFTLRRYDGEEFRFNPTMSLACATGWELDPVFPPLKEMREEPRCARGAWRVGGSVAISGKALYGEKSRDSKHYYEIAQFAARALRGPVRFDAALIAVVVNSSVSDISYRCAIPLKGETTEQCEQRYHDQNQAHLTEIRNVVEQELEALNVDRRLFANVVIMPFCRLGTDAAHSERDNPCKESHRHAQYHATFYSYAMVAPYYRWAVSYDLDEFLANPPKKVGGYIPIEDATTVLDRANRFGRGHMYFTWLNFLINSTQSSRMVSRDLLHGKEPSLITRSTAPANYDCHKFPPYSTGKSAVRCDIGLGFTIHKPVIQDESAPKNALGHKQGKIRSKALRTWHPRLEYSSGKCLYDSSI